MVRTLKKMQKTTKKKLEKTTTTFATDAAGQFLLDILLEPQDSEPPS